ncbi:mammalian ependymin-related protein 1-like [Tubulanus polymorphus]|uniref:mammalian ependymin-related protein 1-like n=1 Tax=Tubulanus polymorphus TaxID=672921 RepID=UPI003DA420C7
MHVLIYLAGFLAFAAAAQAPIPCDAPDRLEAIIITLNTSEKIESRAHYTYDAIGRRERFVDEVNINDDKENYDIIRLYNAGKEYRLNLKTKVCQSQQITHAWAAIQIPSSATYYGEVSIGSLLSSNQVSAQMWGADTPGGRYSAVWTEKDCIPIQQILISKHHGTVQTSYFDVLLGNQDPNVFIPPQECQSV